MSLAAVSVLKCIDDLVIVEAARLKSPKLPINGTNQACAVVRNPTLQVEIQTNAIHRFTNYRAAPQSSGSSTRHKEPSLHQGLEKQHLMTESRPGEANDLSKPMEERNRGALRRQPPPGLALPCDRA